MTVGIKAEDLSKLFKFFGKINSRKDVNRSRMGLGLTISKMLVERLGGAFGSNLSPAWALSSSSHFRWLVRMIVHNSSFAILKRHNMKKEGEARDTKQH